MRQRILLLVAGLAVGLLNCEILTRIFVPDPRFRHENRIDMWQLDPLAGYRNKAHLHAYACGFVREETNALGFRGPEVRVEKPPGTFRIVGLGDSVTWGAGLDEEFTYLRVLERELEAKVPHPPGLRFEAVNTAVVGYSTHQELVTLERDGLPMCPDLVTVGYVGNDAFPTEDPFHNVNAVHKPPNPDVRKFEYEMPRLYPLHILNLARSMVKRAWAQHERAGAPPPALPEEWPKGGFEERTWPIMQEHFREFKRLAAENHFHLLVLLFPGYLQVKWAEHTPFPQSRVAAFLAAEQIDYIEMWEVFHRAGGELFVDWVHPNAAGHRLAAEEILRYAREKGWLNGVESGVTRACAAAPGTASAGQ